MVGCKMGGRGQRGGQPTTCTCFLELEKTKAQAGLSSLRRVPVVRLLMT